MSRHFDNLDAILEFDALDVTVCQLAKGFALDVFIASVAACRDRRRPLVSG